MIAEFKLDTYVFDNKKFEKMIYNKSVELGVPKYEVITFMTNCMKVTKQSISGWKTGISIPKPTHLFWLKEFFHLGSIDIFFKKEG